jgi:hypothetical protein
MNSWFGSAVDNKKKKEEEEKQLKLLARSFVNQVKDTTNACFNLCVNDFKGPHEATDAEMRCVNNCVNKYSQVLPLSIEIFQNTQLSRNQLQLQQGK